MQHPQRTQLSTEETLIGGVDHKTIDPKPLNGVECSFSLAYRFSGSVEITVAGGRRNCKLGHGWYE
jgi:hypothetical protein